MGLSNNLISQFVKATAPKKEEKTPTTTFGTVVEYDGGKYVRLDGSDLLTPYSSTTGVSDGDRVTVTIKNHEAIVNGNITDPAANGEVVKGIAGKVDEFDKVIANTIKVDDIEADTGAFHYLYSEQLKAKYVQVDEITGDTGAFHYLTTDSLDAKYIKSNDIEAENGKFKYLKATELDAKYASVSELEATSGKIDTLESKSITTDNLETKLAEVGTLTAESADVRYASIDLANITRVNISESAWVKDLMVQGRLISMDDSEIYYLTSIHINANDITTGQLSADKLVLLGEDGLYYQLNINSLGETSTKVYEKYVLTSDREIQSGKTYYVYNDGVYSAVEDPLKSDLPTYYEKDNSLYRTIHASNITANTITVEQITTENLQGTNGWINLRDGTFEYFNASKTSGISWDGENLSIRGSVGIGSLNKDLKDVIGSKGTTCTGYDVPTLNNYPASTWESDSEYKNLVPYPYHSANVYSNNGIDYVVNKDGSITCNGTATADSYFRITDLNTYEKALKIPNGQYIVSGSPSGGATSKHYLGVVRVSTDGTRSEVARDVGNGITFTQTDTENVAFELRTVIKSGQTVSNLTFYPMLEVGAVAHDYDPPNRKYDIHLNDLYIVNRPLNDDGTHDEYDEYVYKFKKNDNGTYEWEIVVGETAQEAYKTANYLEGAYAQLDDEFDRYRGIFSNDEQRLSQYISITDDGLFIGAVNKDTGAPDDFYSNFRNDAINFMKQGDDNPIAYIKVSQDSQSELSIYNAEVQKRLNMGEADKGWYSWIPRANGHLSLKWIKGGING